MSEPLHRLFPGVALERRSRVAATLKRNDNIIIPEGCDKKAVACIAHKSLEILSDAGSERSNKIIMERIPFSPHKPNTSSTSTTTR